MFQIGIVKVEQTKDWSNHSKIVIRTDNPNLLQALLHRTAELSRNGLGRVIFSYGQRDRELRIFTQLGSAEEVLTRLLEGEDQQRLTTEATIQTIN